MTSYRAKYDQNKTVFVVYVATADFHSFRVSSLFERALVAAFDDLQILVSVGIKRSLSPHLIHYVMFLLFYTT